MRSGVTRRTAPRIASRLFKKPSQKQTQSAPFKKPLTVSDRSMMILLAQDPAVQSRIEWRNLPESWQVFVFIGVVVALLGYVIWSYLREIQQLPIWARWVLAGLRVAIVVLLIILYLDPVKTDYREIQRRPTVALLSDLSQSMSQKDAWSDDPLANRVAESLEVPLDSVQAGSVQRLDLLKKILLGQDGMAQRLRDKAHVRVLTFGDRVDTVTTLPTQEAASASESADPSKKTTTEDPSSTSDATEPEETNFDLDRLASQWQADGAGSDLVDALQSSLNINQLQAIYLLTDGQHTAPTQPVEIARRARELGIPIYAIGIGDPARPKNVGVKDVSALEKARPNEPFAIDAILAAQQLAGTRLQVELLRETIDSSGKPMGDEIVTESREIVVDDQAWLLRERFTQRIDQPGQYRYRVRIESVEGELTDEDNTASTSIVEITTEKVKLLMISGTASWEYRQLQKLFQRDQGISLSCWLQSMAPERSQEGNDPIAVLPRTFEQMAQYNAILMIDPNPDEFDEEWIKNLTRFVEQKAGGLMFVAGQKYTTDFFSLARTEGIRTLLPVRLETGGDAALSTLLQTSSGMAGFQPVSANLDHQVLGFAADRADNLRIWENMPGIYWSYPAIEGKPTSKTLLEHKDTTLALEDAERRPLLIAGRYGAGNTLYMGFSGSWRWRSVGVQAEYFDRFWIQAVRYLVNTRSIQGLKRGTIDPDREYYELGDRVEFTARLLDPSYNPLELPDIPGQIQAEDGTLIPITFRMVETQPGTYIATWRARTTGAFQAMVSPPDVNDSSLLEAAKFRVEAPSAEARATWLNESLLEELCEASGGKYYAFDQSGQAVDDLPTIFESVQWREPPKPVWDLSTLARNLMFILPVILLAIEWSIRKWLKLL